MIITSRKNYPENNINQTLPHTFLRLTLLPVALCLIVTGCISTQQVPIETENLRDNLVIGINAADPEVVLSDDRYYLFHTGRGIATWVSRDRNNWIRLNPVFESEPDWVAGRTDVGNISMTAADIFFKDDRYFLIYKVQPDSTGPPLFGVATNQTLDPRSNDFEWVDQGNLFSDMPDSATKGIRDLSIMFDERDSAWLVANHRPGTVNVIEIQDDAGSPPLKTLDDGWLQIAHFDPNEPESTSTHGYFTDSQQCSPDRPAIQEFQKSTKKFEKPVIAKRDDYFYLFMTVSKRCDSGSLITNSIVGRSVSISGPYHDQNGIALDGGGGSQFFEGDQELNSFFISTVQRFKETDYLIGHTIDSETNRANLLMLELTWSEDSWPIVLVNQLSY